MNFNSRYVLRYVQLYLFLSFSLSCGFIDRLDLRYSPRERVLSRPITARDQSDRNGAYLLDILFLLIYFSLFFSFFFFCSKCIIARIEINNLYYWIKFERYTQIYIHIYVNRIISRKCSQQVRIGVCEVRKGKASSLDLRRSRKREHRTLYEGSKRSAFRWTTFSNLFRKITRV